MKILFLVLMIDLSMGFDWYQFERSIEKIKNEQSQGVCKTQACHDAAEAIKSSLDVTVDPCDNFYDFVCGGWLKSYELPAYKTAVSTFSLIRDENKEKIAALLKEPSADDEATPVTSAKNFYRSCMDIDRLNELGHDYFKVWINRYIGKVPLFTQNWDQSSFDMTEVLIKITQYSVQPFFSMYASADNIDTDKNVLKIDQPSLGMPGQKYYSKPRDDPMIVAYENFIYRLFQKFGFSDSQTSKKDVADIIDFEIDLAKIHVSDETRRVPQERYHPTTLGQLHHSLSVPGLFDFKKFVTTLLSTSTVGVYDVKDDEVIINCAPGYFKAFVWLIRDTPKKIIANYMMMRVVKSHISKLPPDDFDPIILDYSKALYGLKELEDRDKVCTSRIADMMDYALSYPFLKLYFNKESKTTADEMVTGIRAAFREIIDESDWMDSATRRIAKTKLKAVTQKIGYPDWLSDPVKLTEKLINQTSYEPDKYFLNYIKYEKEGFADSLRHLREPVDRAEWDMAPIKTNAYYSRWMNEIVFPAGVLQPPFFNKDNPKYLNYGGIGSVIGHEITHGFDDRGAQHDEHGRMIPWWSDSTKMRFKEKGQCLLNQYNNFVMPENNMSINAALTKGENIADNGGLKEAYRAYRQWVTARGNKEPRLPGLKYTSNQLFFISSGRLWCDKRRTKAVMSQILTNVHCPGRYRAIGPEQNLPEFSEAFHCSKKSYMNPRNKCAVW